MPVGRVDEEESFQLESSVRWHHIFTALWTPHSGKLQYSSLVPRPPQAFIPLFILQAIKAWGGLGTRLAIFHVPYRPYGCDCWTAVQREDSPRESPDMLGSWRICLGTVFARVYKVAVTAPILHLHFGGCDLYTECAWTISTSRTNLVPRHSLVPTRTLSRVGTSEHLGTRLVRLIVQAHSVYKSHPPKWR